MAVDTNTGKNDVRFRTVTLSLRVDEGCTEEIIQELFKRWYRGIKGGAYILHDKDEYTEREVKDINGRIDKEIKALHDSGSWTQEAEDALNDKKIEVGEHKPDHWHILLDFGTNAKSAQAIATMLHTVPNMVQQVRGKKKGFANMLAYFTHITPQAMADGKFEYDPSEVKGLIFPKLDIYEQFQDYEDFAKAYLEGTLTLDITAKDVLLGKITPRELMDKDPEYFLKHEAMINRARLNYNNRKPTPSSLFNYFVGAGASEREGTQGRIGKGIMCKALAIAHLSSMYPKVNFFDMTDDELRYGGYIYWAGGAGTTFQGYDGQPIIIWEDCRAYDLIKTFGGINNVFKSLDPHPKPVGINIKYGEVYLKNSIFIFDGAQTYSDFINDLSVEWKRELNDFGNQHNVMAVKEDKSQAKGRFPFIVEITPSTISATVQLEYLIGTTRFNSRHTFKNDLRLLAQAKKLDVASNSIGTSFVEASRNALTVLDTPQPMPNDLLRELDEDEADELKKQDGVMTSEELSRVREVSERNELRRQTEKSLREIGTTIHWLDDE